MKRNAILLKDFLRLFKDDDLIYIESYGTDPASDIVRKTAKTYKEGLSEISLNKEVVSVIITHNYRNDVIIFVDQDWSLEE